MVQYIHHPEFTWYKLRENRTGEFENKVSTPPDQDEPVLTVVRLATPESDKIGLWTGNGSSGRYRNLKLTD